MGVASLATGGRTDGREARGRRLNTGRPVERSQSFALPVAAAAARRPFVIIPVVVIVITFTAQ